MTLNFAIGKNTAEGKSHMMCIDGTEGEILQYYWRYLLWQLFVRILPVNAGFPVGFASLTPCASLSLWES